MDKQRLTEQKQSLWTVCEGISWYVRQTDIIQSTKGCICIRHWQKSRGHMTNPEGHHMMVYCWPSLWTEVSHGKTLCSQSKKTSLESVQKFVKQIKYPKLA